MIEVENLRKLYGAIRAVDDISFVVPPGRVVGFLGPNGAGKSTAMRAMVGLTPPTSGHVRILGLPYEKIPMPGRHVGVLLDAAAQHDGRTGREILTLGAMMCGAGKGRVDEMLHLVGLTDSEAKRRVKNYSLGMRQRLGIAHALLGDPQVLILDEPANGLDPQGIHWMRGLLRRYADEGGTVLLSSHLLHEVEVIADELVLIGRGRIVAEGTKAELLGGSGCLVRALDPAALEAALVARGMSVHTTSDGALTVDAQVADVGRAALDAGVVLTELRPGAGAGLEDMFLQLTAETSREGAAA